MHYYKRNLGDYAKKAGRLSMLQHGSFTLLLDACYDREQFPTEEEALEWTWASTPEEEAAVRFVLKKFFVLEDGKYVQKRVQEELAEYHGKAQTNKRIALERETKRRGNRTVRSQPVNTPSPPENEPPPNHKPLTINQEPRTKDKNLAGDPRDLRPDDVDEQVWQEFVRFRKFKKAPISPIVVNSMIDKAREAGMTTTDAIKAWILSGTTGFYPPKLGPGNAPGNRQDANLRASQDAERLLFSKSTSEVIGV